MFEIKPYSPEDASEWNRFVSNSKNATFLLSRKYMDYHADRFEDYSLFFYRDGELAALLPANRSDDTLWSHAGLTYGGLITDENFRTEHAVSLFRDLNEFLAEKGFRKIVYKCIPWIYHMIPAEEDLYAIFYTSKPRLAARHVASVICQNHPVSWKRDRRYAANKATRDGIVVCKSEQWDVFWKILEANLMNTYGTKPVHSLDEIHMLKAKFPENIHLYLATKDGEALGGTVLYESPQVLHAQYISATQQGKRLHAIDAIYKKIILEDFSGKPYIDFGKSSNADGHELNETLIYQKEGFGARAVCYDWYEWDL